MTILAGTFRNVKILYVHNGISIFCNNLAVEAWNVSGVGL